MKRLLALALVLLLFASLQTTAFAARDDQNPRRPTTYDDGYEGDGGPVGKYDLYNADDELIGQVLASQVLKLEIGAAGSLNRADGASFVKSYRAAKAVDKHLRYVQWIDIPEEYKTDDLAYMTYYFDCEGWDVEATVNGSPIEVSRVRGIRYCAKMTEFGTLAVYNQR